MNYTVGLIPNRTEDAHCQWCCNDAVVPVAQETRRKLRWNGKHAVDTGETYLEEVYGPCPACERGNDHEFPSDGKWGPWGRDGYWKGRPYADLPRQCRCKERLLSRNEARESVKKLRVLLGGMADAMTVSTRRRTPPVQTVDALIPSGVTPASTGVAADSTGAHTPSPPEPIDVVPSDTTGVSGSAGSDTVIDVVASHECAGFDPPKDVPYSKEECATCSPADTNAPEDVIPF